ncbi:glycosyltransferase family 10 domain-containing protein [Rhodoferax sp.]|uniref:glycosyltransferase family 10 domain-containing protein n=1 Tax=Rhodoferax sp. TaxID=50421 RepID=UPI002732EF83|nr:glycosyltransferase family 10 [Rhodoferax sp.]MDP3192343.1 glycosyltransferase family 10 [Rhodoferax sp.]
MRNQQTASGRHIFIDPSYRVFDEDGLFDLSNTLLNRDGQLLPFHRLREKLADKSIDVHTADYLLNNDIYDMQSSDYYSLGLLENIERISREGRARLAAFVIMEPPVVLPHLYEELPRLTAMFDRVYVHNTRGDGYNLDGVNTNKLHKLYWPIPHNNELKPYWGNEHRLKRVVVINGCHNPRSKTREQYSSRIRAMVELSKFGVVDLYGMGWERWWSRAALWLPYWMNRGALMSIYKGACASKFEVLQNYEFCLCFENMWMDGYITEKIFDCLYAGTIPLYMGAPDVLEYIPQDVFVDCRKYSTWKAMWEDVAKLTPDQIRAMKEAGRKFLHSDMAMKFYDSIEHICEN